MMFRVIDWCALRHLHLSNMRQTLEVLACLLAAPASAYFSGSGTCSHLLSSITQMTSRSFQAGDGSYTFTSVPPLSSGKYVGGTPYTVTLSKAASTLNGFLAYAENGGGTRVGTMVAGSGAQLKNCGTGADDTVTHQNGSDKSEVAFTWTAPPAGSGDLTLYGIAYDNEGSLGPGSFYSPMLALTEVATQAPTKAPSDAPTPAANANQPSAPGATEAACLAVCATTHSRCTATSSNPPSFFCFFLPFLFYHIIESLGLIRKATTRRLPIAIA